MNKISCYTEQILNNLPYWFKIKKKPLESIGASFLNVFGLEYDDMRYILEYAFKQTYINQMDINYLNRAYKAYIPISININEIKTIKSEFIILQEALDLSDFFNITFDHYENPDNFDKDVYMLDTEKEIIYVKKEYDRSDKYKFGKLAIVLNDDSEIIVELIPHSVWNYFDEIGLLLDCKRLYGEDNYNYKNRLLNVFKHIQNSSKEGLMNAISNELSLRKTIIWEDTSKDLVLYEPMIIVNKIKINDVVVPISNIYTNNDGHIVIKKDWYQEYNEVSYVYNMELHSLCDKNDKKLYSELFNLDNTATDLMNNFFNQIHTISPIVWDKFIWDKSYWNIIDKEIGGLAFIPNLLDAKIEGFKDYLK